MFQLFWYFWKNHARDPEWFGRQTWGQLQACRHADRLNDSGEEEFEESTIVEAITETINEYA
jgi:hypothetical protein